MYIRLQERDRRCKDTFYAWPFACLLAVAAGTTALLATIGNAPNCNDDWLRPLTTVLVGSTWVLGLLGCAWGWLAHGMERCPRVHRVLVWLWRLAAFLLLAMSCGLLGRGEQMHQDMRTSDDARCGHYDDPQTAEQQAAQLMSLHLRIIAAMHMVTMLLANIANLLDATLGRE